MDRPVSNKIRTQHQLLESSLAGALRAADRQDRDELGRKLQSLTRSLETHLSLEEDHYFPEKKQSDPELASEIDDLVLQHDDLRASLQAVIDFLAEEKLEKAGGALREYADVFRTHEKLERELLE